MSDVVLPEYMQLFMQAWSVPQGREQVAILERAVELADAAGDVQAGFRIRERLLDASVFGGFPEKTLATFAWCLALCDRDPKTHPESSILWQYKWATRVIFNFPAITAAQIEHALTDMEQRYLRNGWGPRGPAMSRFLAALGMGQLDRAASCFKDWKAAPRDEGSDCPACDQDHKIEFHQIFGRHAEALRAAEPILEGRMSCAEVPLCSWGRVQLSLLAQGRTDEAVDVHLRSYRGFSKLSTYVEQCGLHFEFLVATDNTTKGLALLERSFSAATAAWDALARLRHFIGARLLLLRVVERSRRARKLRFSKDAPFYRPDATYDTAELLAWFDREARELAAQFDRRNGNTYYADRIEAAKETLTRVSPVSLSREE